MSRGANDPSPLNIYRASTENLKIKMLLYGVPGAGKTTMALTANDHPDLSPALLLNFEGGWLSVVGRGDVDVIDIASMDDLERVFWYFVQDHESVRHFKTVIVDSGSELYQKALREVVDQNMLRRPNRKGDEDDFELEDYGKAGNITFRMFSAFRDLPRHVIVTSHAKFIYPAGADQSNPNLQPREVRPSFSSTLSNRLTGVFDFVHFLYAADEEVKIDDDTTQIIPHRYLLTRSMGAYQAKTRGPSFATALGDVVVDPNLPMLYDLLMQTEGGQNGRPDDYPSPGGVFPDNPNPTPFQANTESENIPEAFPRNNPDTGPVVDEAELEEVIA